MTNGLAALVQQYLARMTSERREYFYSLCPAIRTTETEAQSDAKISEKGEITSCAAKTSTPQSVTLATKSRN